MYMRKPLYGPETAAAAGGGGDKPADQTPGSAVASAAADAVKAADAAKANGASAEEVQELRAKVEKFDKLNQRYLKDESFRKVFDAAWRGEALKPDAKPDTSAASDDDVGDTTAHDPVKPLRDEMNKLRTDLDEFRNAYGTEKVIQHRDGINSSYESEFKNLADTVNYQPGTPAYRSLHTEVVDNARQLAEKYGLKDESGNANPLLKFSKELLKESFDKAVETHRQAGFLDAWEQKRQIEARKIENKPASDRKAFFEKNKDLLKTTEGRGKVMEMWIKKKFPDLMG